VKIAVNILPLKTGHKDRGIGYYTHNLLEALKADDSIEVVEFSDSMEIKNVDLVHYPWFDFYFHSLPIRKSFPTVVTIHDVIPLKFADHYPSGLRGKVNLSLQRLALSNCKHILTDSNISKEDIIKFLRVKNEKISVIYPSPSNDFKVLSDTRLLLIRRKYSLPDRYLLYVGDSNWTKNLPFLIENFSKIIQTQAFSDLQLVLVGGVFLKKVENIDHPELQSLKEVNRMIDKLKLSSKVIRPGNLGIKDLAAFYNLATIYIQPSFYEGFGLPLLEAMACGTPVVSSSGGSLPEIGGDAPVYFNSTNSEQFISILLEILGNISLQNKLSNLGLKRAKKFSSGKFGNEIKEIYSEIINQ